MSELRQAAQAVVDRWDTPLWKDAPHTAEFIDRLRAALAAPPMSERERFEAWMSDDGKWPRAIERDSKGEYLLAKAASDWTVWQAALARSGQAASGSSQGARSDDLKNLADALTRFYANTPVWAPEDRMTLAEAARLIRSLADSPASAAAARAGQPEAPTAAPLYVACHECDDCGHTGINDESDSASSCSKCQWSGQSPVEDVCPDCGEEGTMHSACPKCGGRYRLIADGHIHHPPTHPAGEPMAAAQGGAEAWRHVANEWADATSNALQGLRNVRDGIDTTDEVIASVLRDIEHCTAVTEAAPREGTALAASPPAPAQAAEDARDAERWRWIEARFRVFSLDISGRHTYCATGEIGRIRGSSLGAAVDAAIAASKPQGGAS